ncbi:MAG: hypothetical protein U0229_08920 [Anaeromyxobacter sp.]
MLLRPLLALVTLLLALAPWPARGEDGGGPGLYASGTLSAGRLAVFMRPGRVPDTEREWAGHSDAALGLATSAAAPVRAGLGVLSAATLSVHGSGFALGAEAFVRWRLTGGAGLDVRLGLARPVAGDNRAGRLWLPSVTCDAGPAAVVVEGRLATRAAPASPLEGPPGPRGGPDLGAFVGLRFGGRTGAGVAGVHAAVAATVALLGAMAGSMDVGPFP